MRRRVRLLRPILVAAVAAVCLLGIWIALCVRFVAHPDLEAHRQVDALYVLGPVETRLEPALALMDAGVAPMMLATTSINEATGLPYFTDHCGRVTATYRIECVVPEPYTTRGEARLLAEQVKAHGWRRVAILTSTAHAARARMLMQRCVAAEVLVWDYSNNDTLTGWLGEFVHQSGGWAQAQLDSSC